MNDSITFDSNMYAKHDKYVELTNSLSNEEKCLLITTLASSMNESVDVLLTDKDDNVKAVFGCKNTWLTASLNGLSPVFSFQFDYVSMVKKGKDSIDKHITKHLEQKEGIDMPKYTVITTLTTHFEEVIEASSEEEAREIYQDMMEKDTISTREIGHGDSGEFYINEILKGDIYG